MTGALAQAFAAGALLTMIADDLIPVARELAELEAGLAAVIGFAVAFALHRAGTWERAETMHLDWSDCPDLNLDVVRGISHLRDDSGVRMAAARTTTVLIVLGALTCTGCGDWAPKDVSSLFAPTLHRSEIIGFLAGFGTTFAAVPDLVAMFRRRSTAGMNPRMAAIMGVFQILWVYYGLLIASRPVIAWNVIGVVINLSLVLAYRRLRQRELLVRPHEADVRPH